MKIREEILNINYKINHEKGYSTELIKDWDLYDYSDSDKKLFVNIVYGVLENRIYIDYIINKYSNINIYKLDNTVLEILRMSIYQLVFMDKIPQYAIINEAVEISKDILSTKESGYINAVLRACSRDINNASTISTKNVNEQLSIKYSINKNLLDILLEDYSKKTTKKILKSFMEIDDFIIKTNLLKISTEELLNRLIEKHFNAILHPYLESAIIVKNPYGILNITEFKEGCFLVQNTGSILVSKALRPEKNSVVLDMCAAPGSKTCNLSEIMDNTGIIYANDIYSSRIKSIHENADRLGCTNIKTINNDATKYNKDFEEKFDYTLLDAPCSGLGIVSGKPEIKLNRSIKEIETLVSTQKKLLENAYAYLKKGGYLVYSTCSILSVENENQREWFLNKFKNIEPVDIMFRENYRDYIKIMPYENYSDGFFISKFRKI